MSYSKRVKMKLTGDSLTYYFIFSIMATAVVCGPDVQLNRTSFPEGFIFGTASSAYQYEGAANEGGKGPSIWDTFTHKHPEMISDRSSGDIAIDSYHRYKDDIKTMKDMGLDAYRFSISWPRILPNGTLSGGINKEGIDYYNKFINRLISEGLQPFVTLFHWDLPQSLEDNYGGFLSANIAKDFHDYAEVCFREFGDRVKHWITLNEPFAFSAGGYAAGFLAPNRCSPGSSIKCRGGDSGREPYIVGHNQLLAHAAAVSVYRRKYKVNQNGMIGITLVSNWMIPYFNSKSSDDAVERALDFMYGWFMDPITQGDYPFNMRALVGSRLPKFTEDQSKMVQGSFDFIGLNYYTSNYVCSVPIRNYVKKTYETDGFFNKTEVRNGVPIGPQASGAPWLYVYPKGIKDLLLYTKTKYNNPIIYITENGLGDKNNGTQSLKQALQDDTRVDYHRQHLYYIHSAIKKGVDVRGYFAWSLMDNFEWGFGFTVRFGMNYVDYSDNLKRYPKKSALWFKKFLKR